MSQSVARRTVTVTNEQGLHARPAYLLASMAKEFDAKIEVVTDNERVDVTSILSTLTLGAEKGTELQLEAIGPDAVAALKALAELFEQGFPGGEKAQTTEQN